MQSVSSTATALPSPEASPSKEIQPLSPFARWVLLLLPLSVVLGPIASFPPNSGGLLSAYRVLYVPAAVFLFITWHRHGRPAFVGYRSLLVLTALLTILGTIQAFTSNYVTERGILDHFMLTSGLLIAWLVAAGVSCDTETRDTLLTGWFFAYIAAALAAVAHATGLWVPQTAINLAFEVRTQVFGRLFGYGGTLGNPNDLAAFAIAAAPVAYLAARRWDRRWLMWLVLGSAGVMILLSQSRFGLGAIFLGVLTFVVLRRLQTPGRVLPVLILGAYLGALLLTLYFTTLRQLLKGVPLLGDVLAEIDLGVVDADQYRVSTWTDLVQETFARIPFGVGPGQYEELAYSLGFALQSNAHNVFLEVIFEYGFLAAVVGAIWVGTLIVNTWQRARLPATDQDNLFVAAGATAMVGLASWGLLTSTLITRPPWALLLGTAVGLISAANAVESRRQR